MIGHNFAHSLWPHHRMSTILEHHKFVKCVSHISGTLTACAMCIVQHWRDSIYMTMNTFYCCTGYFVVVSISQNTSKFIDIIVCFYNKFLNSWRMRPQMCSEKHGLSTSIRGLWNVWIPVVFEHINENSYWPYTRKYCTRSDFDCNERKLILSNIFLNFSLMLVLIDGWISISYE